jgi:hypothetical protein
MKINFIFITLKKSKKKKIQKKPIEIVVKDQSELVLNGLDQL